VWARGPCPTWVPGPSTSPLERMREILGSDETELLVKESSREGFVRR
jgi:hypothetical protein